MTNISKTNEYQWRQEWAHSIAHTDIEPVVEEIQAIEEIHGKITPSLLVQSAKNKKSTLHGYFEWDDSIAAEKYRIKQASTLLGNIEVKIIKDDKPKMIRAFMVKSSSGFSGEMNAYGTVCFDDEGMKVSNKKIAMMNLTSSVKKLSIYPEFSKAVEYISKAIEELTKVSTETPEVKAEPLMDAV